MKSSTLELLCCPRCKAALSLHNERGDEIVAEGYLFCPNCEQRFLIKNGVAYFIDPQELEGINRRFACFYDWFSRFYDFFTRAAFLSFGGDRKARKEVLDRLELNGERL